MFCAMSNHCVFIPSTVAWTDHKGKHVERTVATDPFSQVSVIVESKDGHVHTQAEGAVFVIFRKSQTSGKPPYSDMKQLVAHNIFPSYLPQDVRNLDFPWVKVEDRSWANGRFKVSVRRPHLFLLFLGL